MEATKNIPKWFWAILGVIVLAVIIAIFYCNRTESVYQNGVKNSLDIAASQTQSTNNTTTQNNTTTSPPQIQSVANQQPTSNIFDMFDQLAQM